MAQRPAGLVVTGALTVAASRVLRAALVLFLPRPATTR